MADLNDPAVAKFLRETLRPVSEDMRDLHARMTDAKAFYQANIAPKLAGSADGDVVLEGRDASEGVEDMTKADITAIAGAMNDVLTALDAVGVMDNVRKGVVRQLRV